MFSRNCHRGLRTIHPSGVMSTVLFETLQKTDLKVGGVEMVDSQSVLAAQTRETVSRLVELAGVATGPTFKSVFWAFPLPQFAALCPLTTRGLF